MWIQCICARQFEPSVAQGQATGRLFGLLGQWRHFGAPCWVTQVIFRQALPWEHRWSLGSRSPASWPKLDRARRSDDRAGAPLNLWKVKATSAVQPQKGREGSCLPSVFLPGARRCAWAERLNSSDSSACYRLCHWLRKDSQSARFCPSVNLPVSARSGTEEKQPETVWEETRVCACYCRYLDTGQRSELGATCLSHFKGRSFDVSLCSSTAANATRKSADACEGFQTALCEMPLYRSPQVVSAARNNPGAAKRCSWHFSKHKYSFFPVQSGVTKTLMASEINGTILLTSVFPQGITRGVQLPAILFDQAVRRGSWPEFLVRGCCALQHSQSAFTQGVRWSPEVPDLVYAAAVWAYIGSLSCPFSHHIALGGEVKW